MKKLFTLTDTKEIHLTDAQKIIPAEEFATLLEAKETVEKAQEEALLYRKKVAEECELLKEEGEKEGFDQGLLKFNQQWAYLEKEVAKQKEEMQKIITSLATAAVKKIIGKELDAHPELIIDLISTALKPVSQHRKISLFVNQDDLEEVEKNRPKIKALFEHIESLAIQARGDVKKGGCIIETEAGIINAQLENQLRALEQAFHEIIDSNRGALS